MKVVLFQTVHAHKSGDRSLICRPFDDRYIAPFFPKGAWIVGEQWNFQIQDITYFLEGDILWYQNNDAISQEAAIDLVANFGWEWDADI